jgi:mitogen-activated protein kinase kinase
MTAYRVDPRQAADHANLAAQVDRLYIREWDHE